MFSFNLTIGTGEPPHLLQCLDLADDLDRVFFHPELPVHVYTDGSRDDYFRSGSGIYIKSQNHILRIQRRNPDGCSVFRSELIAIDEAFGSLASLPNGKEIWILSDSRSAIQHLSNWQSWIPSHIDLEGNEIADSLTKAGACEVPEPSAPLTFLEIFSRTKLQIKTAWVTPQSTIAGHACSHPRLHRTHQAAFSRRSLSGVGLSESVRCHGTGLELLTNGGVQQQHGQDKTTTSWSKQD
ncbi:RNase H domain-containing protein [Trichonephila clavipes]|nr:RNase H domain-containing protein [Trichonephila clavipes]